MVTNFRIDAVARLGLAYDDVAAVNPAIVYVQASGYGPRGDDASTGAFDFLAQARGGFASTNGEPDDPPVPAAVPIADQTGALHACIAALAGLAARNATGRGGRYDTSLLGSVVGLQSFDITTSLFSGRLRSRAHRGGARPFWRIYQGGDGAWFCIGMLLDRAWEDVCRIVNRPDLLDDPRFATYRLRVWENAADLCAILDEAFATAPARHWIDELNAVGMFAAPVQDHHQLAEDPQVVANDYIHDVPSPRHGSVRMAGSGFTVDGEPLRIARLAPEHGEHTEETLAQAGYSWDEITELREAGVIGPRAHRPTETMD
jgi:crotonobetainyl-CoA:carnitine CoA-transferase CaiB-like acyl-CoA transferase